MNFQLLFFLFICLSVSHVDAQYITLNGNRFHDQTGEPFYPVICNYGVRLSCQNCNTGSLISGFSEGRINCNPADYTLHPNHYYGSTMEFEEPFNKGLEKIKADLIKIKQMGFNTIRTMIEFHENKHFKMVGGSVVPDEPGGRVICLKYGNAKNDASSWWGSFFRIMPPYDADDNLQDIMLPAIHDFLDVAAEAELHVILVTGGSYISASGDASYNRDAPVENLAQAEDYRDYLEVLTDNLKNRPELLAYDLFNEMAYGVKKWNPDDPIISDRTWGPFTTNKKEEICNFTAMWYDAIKAVDPNHIVSLSSGNIFAVRNYDPAIMKVDLHDYHEYPYNHPQGFELWGNFYTSAQIRERWLSRYETMFYWMKNNNPMPWILGETAASAWTEEGNDIFGQDDSDTDPAYTSDFVGMNFSQPPFSYGSYEDQIDFARQTQQMVLNHSGSGYGWWEFMWDEKSPPFNNANAFSDQYIGLLDKGDPAALGGGYVYDNSLDRPIIAAFDTDPITKPQPGTGNMPANYYNPFGGDSTINYFITGTVIDQDNNPIKDAILNARNNWGDNVVPDEYKFDIHTFSRENGNFSLTAPIGHFFNTEDINDPDRYDYSKFIIVYFNAPAARNSNENEKNKVEYWNIPDIGGNINANLTKLQRMTGVFDKTVVDEVINNGNSLFEASARNVLKVKNTLVEATGIADFHASQAVVVEDYFITTEGSYVDIYIAPVDFNCVDFPDPVYKTDETNISPVEEQTLPAKSFEVRYTLLQSSMRLMPNPATDVVFIESEMKEDCYLTITDMNGKQVFSDNFNLPTKYEINVSAFAPGNYLVKAITESQTETFKLFISKN